MLSSAFGFAVDPAVKEYLKVDNFVGDFFPKHFVESVTLPVFEKSTDGFDTKPLIRTFEAVQEELSKLKRTAQTKIADLEDSAAAADVVRRKQLGDLTTQFDDVRDAFGTLESRITDVGDAAVRIGEQMETIDKQRARAVEARDLIMYFLDFNQGDGTLLQELRSQGIEGEYKAAIMARRLQILGKEIDAPGTEGAKEKIEEYCENLEKSLLESFDHAYRMGDIASMAACARTLYEFNGGASCIQTYVNQHEFFINNERVMDIGQNAGQYGLGASNVTDPGLAQLFDDIRETVEREWEVIRDVFPNSQDVVQTFVQRIFDQSVQGYLEAYLEKCKNHSTLSYLRALSSSHSAAKKLVSELQSFDRNEVSRKPGLPGGLSTMLDRALEDLFIPYTGGNRYIEREMSNLQDLFSKELQPLIELRNKTEVSVGRALLTRALDNIQTASEKIKSSFGATTATDITFTPPTTGPIAELLRFTDPEFMVHILSLHSEALIRCIELSGSTEDVARNVDALYRILVDVVGRQFIIETIQWIEADLRLSLSDTKHEPEYFQLAATRQLVKSLQLMQLHFSSAVAPAVAMSPSVHRDVTNYKNQFVADVDRHLGLAMIVQLEVVTKWMSVILSKQKKSDYRPKGEVISDGASQTCLAMCAFLKKIAVAAAALRTMDNDNALRFLEIVGETLYELLLTHYKQYQVSPMGALVVSKDISTYCEAVAQFGVRSINDKFLFLREIGTLFLIKTENLAGVLSEGTLSKLDKATLQSYLDMRVDAKTTISRKEKSDTSPRKK